MDGKCKNCRHLVRKDLVEVGGTPHFWSKTAEGSCRTCRLLYDGIAIAAPYSNHETVLRWEIHVQNGLIVKGTGNGDVMVEFYCTSGNSDLPDAIGAKDHVTPWWQDHTTISVCRAAANEEQSLPASIPRPTRLLDLGLDSALESDLRLTRDTAKVSQYATLSHCWLQADSEPVQTRIANVSQHLQRIKFASLSPTFQQAVKACRRLHIGHLWIDSLCIVQDDRDDWEREGSNMDNIYAGACVTLAMHSNAEGFMPYHTLPFPLHGGSTGKIHVRQLTNHPDLLHHVAAAPKAEDKDRIAPNGAWGRVSLRGWCYQERALSRRVFHITSDELLIEQGGRIVYCQCSHHHRNSQVGFAGWLTGGSRTLPTDQAKYTWSNVISQYTQRMFSFESDLLPGLAGLARRLSTEFGMGPYFAGLWRENLLRWLCWKSVSWKSEIPGDICPNCRPYPRRRISDGPLRAPVSEFVPSFSWASRFGPCEFMHDPWRLNEYVAVAEVIRADCRASQQSPFGRILAGFIDLKANLYRALHFSTTGWSRNELVGMNLCLTQHAYVVDEGFPSRWDMSAHKEIFSHVKGCGRRFKVDASDDLPPDGSVVYLLELFYVTGFHRDSSFDEELGWERTIPGERAIMLILVPDESKTKAIEANGLGRPGEDIQSFRRIGIGIFGRFEFLDMGSPEETIIRLV
ncbi:hypothetical protein FALCPG4_005696 [Fusarium falciforme]